jgi:protein O-mannosyl-transferase
MSLMYLLTLYGYVRWRIGGDWRWATATMVAFVLGMMSKPVMVTAPVVVLAYEVTFLHSPFREVIRRAGWMYGAMLVLAGAVAFLTQGEMTPAAGFTGRYTPLEYAAVEVGVVCHYLWLSVWPAKLSVFTDWPKARGLADVLPPAILLGAILAAAVFAWRRGGRGYAFLAIWFFAILAPTSSFIPVDDAIFEHRMYLPLMAVVVLAVVGLHQAGRAVLKRAGASPERRRACVMGGACLAGALAIVLAVCTGQRNLVYRSDETLWKDVLDKQPDNARAMTNYGHILLDRKNVALAKSLFEKSLALRPDYSDTWNDLGVACAEQGDFDAAIGHYKKAIEVRKGLPFPDAWYNLGNALQRQGSALREQAAKPDADESARKGLQAQAKAKFEEAITQYEAALRQSPVPWGPRQGSYCSMKAMALVQLERWEEAGRDYERALDLHYEDADLHNNFAVVLNKRGQRDEAIRHLKRALRLNPNDAGALRNLRALQGGL